MPDADATPAPATHAEVVDALATALRFDRHTRHHPADDMLSLVAAEHIAEQLQDRFVLLRRPVLPLPLTP